ncbi:MAG: hypothetical protein U5N86_05445 [Planctomycetota bacterium]|nr:hypothetical protein [Planctomycetota bacterium]
MNNKDREEKIQLILDGKLDDENELSQDERRELNGHRKLDSLLSEAFSNSDVDTTPLEGFVPYKRERRSFPLPQLHLVAAAAVIIIVAAASFFFLYTSAPEGDGAKLARYREAALNGEAAPPVLEQSQKQYLDYLADFYGSYAKLSPDKLRDELNAAWEQSCVNAFERVLTETETRRHRFA